MILALKCINLLGNFVTRHRHLEEHTLLLLMLLSNKEE